MTPTSIVAYLALFATVGVLFLFVSLLLGRLVRSSLPTPQKVEPYECGEQAVGSSFVQFDLRFYVVALVFIVFEVEVALFFPPAVVFGKVTQMMGPQVPATVVNDRCEELGIRNPGEFGAQDMYPSPAEMAPDAQKLALAVMADLGIFFAVILVGFAYVWHRGDLDWVRAIGHRGERGQASEFKVIG